MRLRGLATTARQRAVVASRGCL